MSLTLAIFWFLDNKLFQIIIQTIFKNKKGVAYQKIRIQWELQRMVL